MRTNVPRLGPSAGYVHAHTGLFQCKPTDLEERQRSRIVALEHKPVRPTAMTPEFIDHTLTTFASVCNAGATPSPNLRMAIFDMLTELKRLKS